MTPTREPTPHPLPTATHVNHALTIVTTPALAVACRGDERVTAWHVLTCARGGVFRPENLRRPIRPRRAAEGGHG